MRSPDNHYQVISARRIVMYNARLAHSYHCHLSLWTRSVLSTPPLGWSLFTTKKYHPARPFCILPMLLALKSNVAVANLWRWKVNFKFILYLNLDFYMNKWMTEYEKKWMLFAEIWKRKRNGSSSTEQDASEQAGIYLYVYTSGWYIEKSAYAKSY